MQSVIQSSIQHWSAESEMHTQSQLRRQPRRRIDYVPTEVHTPLASPYVSSSKRKGSMSEEERLELEAVNDYFSKPYIGLSHLPTPPTLIDRRRDRFREEATEGGASTQSILGSAKLLAAFTSSSAPCNTSSVSVMHSILSIANLPLHTLAFAIRILESLDNSFFLQASQAFLPTNSLGPGLGLVPFCAIILAYKFDSDNAESTRYLVHEWGRGLWSCKQVNTTELAILSHLDWRLNCLCVHEEISRVFRKMESAAETPIPDEGVRNTGKATMVNGEMTPAATPEAEAVFKFT